MGNRVGKIRKYLALVGGEGAAEQSEKDPLEQLEFSFVDKEKKDNGKD